MFPKTKPHIFVLLAVLILLGMIVSPVCAARYASTGFLVVDDEADITFTNVFSVYHDASDEGKAIEAITFTIPRGSQVDFTIYYGNNLSVSGSSENHATGLLDRWTETTVTLGGVSTNYTFLDSNPSFDINIVGYAKDTDFWTVGNASANQGFLLASQQYGSYDNDLAVFYQVDNIENSLIYRIDANCSDPFTMAVWEGDASTISQRVSKSTLDFFKEWLDRAWQYSGYVVGFVISLVWILKFFFIDNILLVIALWIGVSMAYSAISTRNIFQFYTKFFRYQRALLDFVVSLWTTLVSVLHSMVNIFVKWL